MDTALTRREHLRLADVLLRAADGRRPIVPLTESYPELTPADAARIRDTAIIGAKVSLGQRSNGDRAQHEEPRLGWLTDEMLLGAPSLNVGALIRPRVEAKVAFELAKPLRARIRSVEDLLALTARVIPCLEILDIRYRSSDVDRVDDIADNCAASGLLKGEGIATPPEDDLLRVRVSLEPQSRPASPAQPIAPVRATLWLANQLIDEAGELEPGALLVSSACCPAIELSPGTRVRADFGPLGRLELASYIG
jgi:2-keto-4-pentenoate hydratase